MGLGRYGLVAWATVAMLTASLPAAVLGQTAATTPSGSTATTKPTSGTTATKPTSGTKPATGTTSAKPAATQGTATAPAKPAPTKSPTAAPAKSTTGTAAAKPATAPKTPVKKETAAPARTTAAPVAAKPAVPASPPAAPSKPAAQPAPKPVVPAQQVTPLRDAKPTATALPGAPAPMAVLPFRQRHPLVGGFLTGLLGVGLADTLLGSEVAEEPSAGTATPASVLEPVAEGLATAEMAGQFTRLALFAGLVALAVAFYRRRMATHPATGGSRRRGAPSLSGWDDLDAPGREPEPAALARPDDLKAIADEQDFADTLLVVQAGWSEGDVMAMRSHVTPDMATYFDRRLAQNAANGVENRVVDVSNVRVERLADWEEEGLHYAKARMRWRALDYVIDMSKLPDEPGYIIDGSLETPVESEEVWTFVKSPDGAWVLCAVEQRT